MLYSLNKKRTGTVASTQKPYTVFEPSSVSSTETPTLNQNTAKTAERCELGIYKKLLEQGHYCFAWEDQVVAFLRASLVC